MASKNHLLYTTSFLNNNNEQILLCVTKNDDGISMELWDSSPKTIIVQKISCHTDTIIKHKKSSQYSGLVFLVSHELENELYRICNEYPYTMEKLCDLPKRVSLRNEETTTSDVRTNGWWALISLINENSFSIHWKELNNQGCHIRTPISTQYTKRLIEISGDTKHTTICYLLKVYGKSSHLMYFPVYYSSIDQSRELYLQVDDKYSVFYMREIGKKIVIIFRDRQDRLSISTLLILVLNHQDKTRDPIIERRIQLKDHPAPVAITNDDENVLKIMYGSKASWIDISRKPEKCLIETFKPDGEINMVKEEEDMNVTVNFEQDISYDMRRPFSRDKNSTTFIIKDEDDQIHIYVWTIDNADNNLILWSKKIGMDIEKYKIDLNSRTIQSTRPTRLPRINFIGGVFFITIESSEVTHVLTHNTLSR